MLVGITKVGGEQVKKNHFLVICGIGFLCISLFFIINEYGKTTLTRPFSVSEKFEDFIIHIRLEPLDEGFQVLRAIEYTGEESVEIRHRSPLIQVTVNVDNATFTGSPVKKRMEPGYQYHPQKPLTFDSLVRGEHTLYVHAQFFLGEERIDVKTKKSIHFE